MYRGSNFGFPSAQRSVPASRSLHTNHFLYLKKSEEEKVEEKRRGTSKTMKKWLKASKAAEKRLTEIGSVRASRSD